MLEYLFNNKEWIFSGIGVTVLGIIVTLLLKRSKNSPGQDNSINVEDYQRVPLICLYSIIPITILKWRFKEQRINSYIKIDIRPNGEAVRLNLGELPDCQIWIQLINHSPFNLDVESIKGELNYNGCRIDVQTKDHVDIEKHDTNDSILLEGKLTGDQAIHCSRENTTSFVTLTLRTRIRTRLGVFKKQSGDLQYFNVSLLNRRKIET